MVLTRRDPRTRKPGNVGTLIMAMRSGTIDNSTLKTFTLTRELQRGVQARRLFFGNPTKNTISVAKAGFVRKANLSAPNISSGTLYRFSFSGGATGTVPASPGGTAVGATTDSAGYAVGATTIGLASSGTGSIASGDVISIGGIKYVVQIGDSDVSNGGSIVLATPLTALITAAPASITITSPRYGILATDWFTQPSLARDDGGIGAVETYAAYIDTAATIGCMGNGTDDYSNWASRTDGRAMIMRYNNGDCIASQGSFSSTTNRSQCPIIGVQYIADGRVYSVGICGDSNAMAVGDTYIGSGFGELACMTLSTANNVKVEWSNFGYAGLNSQEYVNLGLDMLAALSDQPLEALLMPSYTPNDAGASPSQTSVALGAARPLRLAGEARKYGTEPVIYTGFPSNPAFYNFGSADQWRQAKNTEALGAWVTARLSVAAAAEAVSGTISSGQIPFSSGDSTDNVHLNAVGSPKAAVPVAAALAVVLGLN